jgi:hypothetical protein
MGPLVQGSTQHQGVYLTIEAQSAGQGADRVRSE